jgi:hypothetical protein
LILSRGTDGSNPAPSSGESAANLTLGANPAARLPPHVSLLEKAGHAMAVETVSYLWIWLQFYDCLGGRVRLYG